MNLYELNKVYFRRSGFIAKFHVFVSYMIHISIENISSELELFPSLSKLNVFRTGISRLRSASDDWGFFWNTFLSHLDLTVLLTLECPNTLMKE
jgi:hypothetical protein